MILCSLTHTADTTMSVCNALEGFCHLSMPRFQQLFLSQSTLFCTDPKVFLMHWLQIIRNNYILISVKKLQMLTALHLFTTQLLWGVWWWWWWLKSFTDETFTTRFGLIMHIHVPKVEMGFGGIWSLNGKRYQQDPQTHTVAWFHTVWIITRKTNKDVWHAELFPKKV